MAIEMAYRLSSLSESEEPAFAPLFTSNSETLISELSIVTQRALLQAHELVRWLRGKFAKKEDLDAGDVRAFDGYLRFLSIYGGRALNVMERVKSDVRAASADTCAHDEAIDFANAAVGMIHLAIVTGSDESLARLQLPNEWKLNNRVKAESARALERIRAKASETDDDSEKWLTAMELENLTSVNRGTIKRAADRGEIETNNKEGDDKRYRFASFHEWHKTRANQDT